MKTVNTTDRDGIARAVTYSEKDANNNLFVLTTRKYSSGLIVSDAMEHTAASDGALICDIMGCRKKTFAKVKTARVTAAKIQEVHTAAMQLFEQWLKELAEAEPVYKVEPGQIVTASTRYADDGKRYALVTVDMLNCKCVALDGSCFNYFARPHNEKDGRQGIGIYYREGEKLSPEELQELISKAEAAEAAEAQEEARQAHQADQAKAQAIERGREIVTSIPKWAKRAIVANYIEDESDPQSDYHGSRILQTVFLAWSRHDRDRFDEMRAAAGNFEATKHLVTGGEEHRQKYSLGGGYFLKDGYRHSTGWEIRKAGIPELETLQQAAGERRYFIPQGEQAATAGTETTTAPAGTIQIVEHPKRAGKILVIGETYTIRHTLKSLGGWWNKWEKGWEFKADMIDEIARALQPKEETTPEPESAPEPELTAPEVEQAHKDAEPDRQPVTPQVAAPWSEHGKGDYVPAELLPKLIDRIIAMNPAADESSDKAPIVSATADKIEATAAKLVEMAADHRKQMQTKLQEIQKEVEQIATIAPDTGTSKDGFMRVSGPDPKRGRTNTALPAPQLFLMF